MRNTLAELAEGEKEMRDLRSNESTSQTRNGISNDSKVGKKTTSNKNSERRTLGRLRSKLSSKGLRSSTDISPLTEHGQASFRNNGRSIHSLQREKMESSKGLATIVDDKQLSAASQVQAPQE